MGSSRSRRRGSRASAHHLLADGLDLEEVDDVLDHLAVGDLLGPGRAVVDTAGQHPLLLVDVPSDEEVVEDRHPLEERDVLEGPGDAELGPVGGRELGDVGPVELDVAPLRTVDAGDAVEEAGLSGAVGSDDRVQRTASNLEAHVGEGGHPPEVKYQVVDPQERHGSPLIPDDHPPLQAAPRHEMDRAIP
jgi:hypothetical protein